MKSQSTLPPSRSPVTKDRKRRRLIHSYNGRNAKNGSAAGRQVKDVSGMPAALTFGQLKAHLRKLRPEASSASLTVLAVAAHCDDEVLGLGATLRTVTSIQNAAVHVVVFGANNAVRRAESLEACKRMGIPKRRVFLLNFPDGKLLQEPEGVTRTLQLFAEELRPDLVFTHKTDMHSDHCVLFAAVRQCFARRGVSVLNYRIPQPASTAWNPTVYMRICEPTARLKLGELFGAYQTENWKDYFDPVMNEGIMIEAGHSAGCEFAEGFECTQMWLAPCPCGCGSLVLSKTCSEPMRDAVMPVPKSTTAFRIQVDDNAVRIVLEPCRCGCGSIAVARNAMVAANGRS